MFLSLEYSKPKNKYSIINFEIYLFNLIYSGVKIQKTTKPNKNFIKKETKILKRITELSILLIKDIENYMSTKIKLIQKIN